MREAREATYLCSARTGCPDPVSHETILDALKIPDVGDSADRLIRTGAARRRS